MPKKGHKRYTSHVKEKIRDFILPLLEPSVHLTYGEIAQRLNSAGFTSAGGGPVTAKVVHRLISDPRFKAGKRVRGRRPTPREFKVEIVRRYYAERALGKTRADAAFVAKRSIPTIVRWDRELENLGVDIWQK